VIVGSALIVLLMLSVESPNSYNWFDQVLKNTLLYCNIKIRCVEATAVVSTLLSSLPPSNALSKKGNAVATNLRKMTQVIQNFFNT
jgi:hypothetical protein